MEIVLNVNQDFLKYLSESIYQQIGLETNLKIGIGNKLHDRTVMKINIHLH